MSGCGGRVVVAGMAIRVAGADDLDAFWKLLKEARCEVRPSARAALGRARAVLTNADLFDHAFFGYSLLDAEELDPQQRIGLEVAWHALEDAGILSELPKASVGVYAAIGYPAYRDAFLDEAEAQGRARELRQGCKEDFFASRLAVALDARGPVAVYGAACSSSLVALVHAVRDLRAGACDVAVVCAASVGLAADIAAPTEVHALDGVCRPFDASGSGIVGGDGIAAVVLVRADRFRVTAYASILGTGLSNDGSQRMSFTSPSPRGQSQACREAFAEAGIDPRSVSYIEGHGSGTRLGDAIELEALGEVYGAYAPTAEVTWIGSVKGNVGHCDAAAGLVGFVKAALCLHQQTVVATPGFVAGTPLAQWELLPFRVPTRTTSWPVREGPPRAAVHSVGMGGTNAHVLLEGVSEEPLSAPPNGAHPAPRVWCLSARTRTALERQTVALAEWIERERPSAGALAATAVMLRRGRRGFRYRRAVIAHDATSLAEALRGARQACEAIPRGDALFAFGGLGTIPGATRDEDHVAEQIRLARAWMARGVVPSGVIGYSLGELSALAVAGVLSDRDTVEFAARRRRLFERVGLSGVALTVYAAPEQIAPALASFADEAFVSCRLAPRISIVVGTTAVVERLARTLQASGLHAHPLPDARPVHSPLADAAARLFPGELEALNPRPAQLAIALPASNTVLEAGAALDASYLTEQLRTPLCWHETLQLLERHVPGTGLILEMNAGPGVSSLGAASQSTAIRVCAHPGTSARPEHEQEIESTLWALGWDEALAPTVDAPLCRSRLPLYPFERVRCSKARTSVGPSRAGGQAPRRVAPELAPLAAPESAQSGVAGTVSADDRVERTILRIFREELGTSAFMAPDDFFAHGGRSLTALVVVARIRNELGVRLSIADFLESPSPRSLARHRRIAGTMAPGPQEGWLRTRRALDDTAQLRGAVRAHFSDLIARTDRALFEAWTRGVPTPLPEGPLLPVLVDEIHHATTSRAFPHELLRCDSLDALVALVLRVLDWDRPATSSGGDGATLRWPSPSAPRPRGSTSPNPPAVFVLSSARSGSTLLRVMLAGHPHLFSPPELHLLPYADLGARRRGLKTKHFGTGLTRAWQELRQCDAEAAAHEIAAWEDQALSVPEAYRRLQELAAPRILVDKSPGNANSLASLENIDAYFRGAFVVYLHRHPLAVMESYVRNRMDSMGRGADASPLGAAEQHWLDANANICAFLGLPFRSGSAPETPRPHVRVAFERLVVAPEETLRAVCAALGLGFDPAMLEIVGRSRMRDGPGDPGFAAREEVDSSLAEGWRERTTGWSLSRDTVALASFLGYGE